MVKDKLAGHLAIAATYTIFGLNLIFCKDIANAEAVSPIVLFTLRAAGASALFWLISLFLPGEHIAKGDMWKIAFASFTGLFVPQTTFLYAITMATPLDTGILGTLGPIFTMFFAFLFAFAAQQHQFRTLPGSVQAADLPLRRGDLHEVDVPVLPADSPPFLCQRTDTHRFRGNSSGCALGDRLPCILRHLRRIFPHPLRAEEDTSDAGKYVHLPSADNRGCDQRLGRDGHPFLAEGPLYGPHSRRSGARQQEPRGRLEVID